MRLIKHPSLLTAERVVKAMRPLLAPHDDKYMIYLGPYCNGRERGLAVKYGTNTITISEHRNSDSIRIWYGHRLYDFDINSIPKETAMDRTFPPDDVAEAAAFCAYYLLLNNDKEIK